MESSLSIVICTNNRADDLFRTLLAISGIEVPFDTEVELIVVDNGSTDNTAQIIKSQSLSNMSLHYVYENRRGKGFAYNAGVARSTGDILLFTDDDIRPTAGWLSGMCAPIRSGEAHAVAGGVTIAPHLQRPWMTKTHRCALASTEYISEGQPTEMVGANMAFSKAVLEKVPCFDTELGPGALGFSEDQLFSWQLREAGFVLKAALGVAVEHHPDVSRLARQAFLNRAEKQGRSAAYIAYHWQHQQIAAPGRQILIYRLLLARLRLKRAGKRMPEEGCDESEMALIEGISVHQQFLIERKRARNYSKHGLVKLKGGIH